MDFQSSTNQQKPQKNLVLYLETIRLTQKNAFLRNQTSNRTKRSRKQGPNRTAPYKLQEHQHSVGFRHWREISTLGNLGLHWITHQVATGAHQEQLLPTSSNRICHGNRLNFHQLYITGSNWPDYFCSGVFHWKTHNRLDGPGARTRSRCEIPSEA